MFIYKISNKYLRYKCKNQDTMKAFSSFFFFLFVSKGITASSMCLGQPC